LRRDRQHDRVADAFEDQAVEEIVAYLVDVDEVRLRRRNDQPQRDERDDDRRRPLPVAPARRDDEVAVVPRVGVTRRR
jgi:hypothetical protein